MLPDRHCCQTAGERVILTLDRGLISNHVTESSGCGGINCPWVLEAPPGQMFNISLFDFSTFKFVSIVQVIHDIILLICCIEYILLCFGDLHSGAWVIKKFPY